MNGLYRRDSGHQLTKKIKHFCYNIDDKVGKGYSSVVYRGINDLTKQTVAIKAIDMKGVKDSASREMLDCQIQALTKLKHQNILKCYDVVRQTSHCYIITEYCNEGDLSVLLKKKRRLSEKETLKFTKDMVSGFIEMAQKGFLHRDLKLANIFLSKSKAILADFGFAKKHMGVFTREKYNVGSPLYMSPQALKRNIYTIKNDIWSIGIMVFEMLHGETPWECKTEKELMEKMVRIPVKFRDNLNLSEDIKNFIKKCLEVNQDTRMSLQDLKNWNAKNSYEDLQMGNLSVIPNLKKPSSQKENIHGLPDLSNKVPIRSQSNNYSSRPIREISNPQNNSNAGSTKPLRDVSNRQSVASSTKLSSIKSSIQKNNNTLIIEINTFRLLYKIYERLRKYSPEEKELLNMIGNDVLRRVNDMMGLVSPDKENSPINKTLCFGLIDIDNYLNEKTNPSFKKYRNVVKEYHKKYNQEIKIHALGRQVSTKSLMREVLEKGEMVRENATKDELTMVYWMVEFVNLKEDIKKEYLEGIIEPKSQEVTPAYLFDRMKAL